MAEPQAFDPSKPFSIVDAPPPPAGPRGSERTRTDTNMVGIDHDKILQGIANWASKLPEKWQRPAAMMATLPADALASLVEMFSSPEGVATAGAKPAMAGMDAVAATAGKATSAAGKIAGAAVDAADPDLVSIVSPRGGAMLKKAQQVRDYVAARQAATASAPASVPAPPVAPVASAPAAPAPVVAAPAPVAPPVPQAAPPSPQSGPVAPSPGPSPAAAALPDQRALNEAALAIRRQAYQQRLAAQSSAQMSEMTAEGAAKAAAAPAAGNVKLSAAETKAFMDLMKRGMSGPDAMKNVLMQRSLVESLGTPAPTAAQTRFPKGQRGKVMSQP